MTSEEAQEKAEYEQKKESEEVKKIEEEFKEEINKVDKQAKIVKRGIIWKYAKKLEESMPAFMVCEVLCEWLPKEERIIRDAFKYEGYEKYKDLNQVRTYGQLRGKEHSSIHSVRGLQSNDDNKSIEHDSKVEADARVIGLNDELSYMKESMERLQQRAKEKISDLSKPLVIRIPDKMRKKIAEDLKEADDIFALIEPNDSGYILGVFDHSPTPEEIQERCPQ